MGASSAASRLRWLLSLLSAVTSMRTSFVATPRVAQINKASSGASIVMVRVRGCMVWRMVLGSLFAKALMGGVQLVFGFQVGGVGKFGGGEIPKVMMFPERFYLSNPRTASGVPTYPKIPGGVI